jgi:hypothetical protein
MMNEGPLGENDEKMMREKARTSGFISDFTRCKGRKAAGVLLSNAEIFQSVVVTFFFMTSRRNKNDASLAKKLTAALRSFQKGHVHCSGTTRSYPSLSTPYSHGKRFVLLDG